MKIANKYLIAILSVALLLSVGLNAYDRFVLQPSIQTALNNKDVNGFNSWWGLMGLMWYYLDNSKTNFDVENAWKLARIISEDTTEIFTPTLESSRLDLAQNLSSGMTYGAMWLEEGTGALFSGNKTGSVTERELDPTELNMIANLTSVIGNMLNSIRTVSIVENGGSLDQQLQQNNLLAPLATYCAEMMTVGQKIYDYYY